MSKVPNSTRAVLLLGHGSKAHGANETLKKVAARVREKGGYGLVVPAFLQMVEPDFQGGVDIIAGKGFREIIVMPYFLYMGLHVTQDLPGEMDAAKVRYPGLEFVLTKNLDYHDKLVDITVERIDAELGGINPEQAPASPFTQHPIEAESFRILSEELGETGFSALELPIVKRAIHTTADFEYKDILRFSPGAVEAGLDAIRSGKPVITDVKMVDAGITRDRLRPFGMEVYSFSSDVDVIREAKERNITRTAASMQKALGYLEGSIVAIGNAPTALFELIRLVKEGAPRPALVVGVPVGFVGAIEAKEELMRSGLDYIATKGRKGGSTVAAAIVNAIVIEAGQAALK